MEKKKSDSKKNVAKSQNKMLVLAIIAAVILAALLVIVPMILSNSVDCWKCDELGKTRAVYMSEKITAIGKGDINSKINVAQYSENPGSCGNLVYLKKEGDTVCRSLCSNHPNSCWVVISPATCTNSGDQTECVDINGDTTILSDTTQVIGMDLTGNLEITKTGPMEITITRADQTAGPLSNPELPGAVNSCHDQCEGRTGSNSSDDYFVCFGDCLNQKDPRE